VYLANELEETYMKQLERLKKEGIEMLNDIGNEMEQGLPYYHGHKSNPIPSFIFKQTFDKLDLPELRVLEYAAMLPPENIPTSWLLKLVEKEFPVLVKEHDEKQSSWQRLLSKLERFQLLLPSIAESKISIMHRLIQEALRQSNKENIKNFQNQIVAYAESQANFLSDGGWIPQENRWEIAALDTFLRKCLGEENIDVAKTAKVIANIEINIGLLNEAKHLLKETINVQKKHCEPYHHDLMFTYSNLGIVERKLGNLIEAKQFLEHSVTIAEKHFGSDNSDLANIYSALGNVERRLGNLSEAKQLHKQAVTIFEKCSDLESFDLAFRLASSYSNLGSDEYDFGNLLEAKQFYEQAIAIYEKYNPEHHNLATCYSNLSNVESELNNLSKAKLLCERSIAIREKLFNSTHPDLATSYHNLSAVEYKLGNFMEAKKLCMRAITILENHVHDHPDLAKIYFGLAMIEHELGNLIEAKRLYEKASHIGKTFWPLLS
jgi:tetratricopeptide (TPR) repeat protein